MGSESEHVAEFRDQHGVGRGRQRPLLNDVSVVAEDNLVDFFGQEACHLDRRTGQDQLLEFEFQLFEFH